MKVIRIRADELMAGDHIVVKEGTIRKYFHVCEVEIDNLEGTVSYIYNARGKFVHVDGIKQTDILQVREE